MSTWIEVKDKLPEIPPFGSSNHCLISVQDLDYEPEMEEAHGEPFKEFSVTTGTLMRLSTSVKVWINDSGYPVEEFDTMVTAWQYMIEPFEG